MVGKGLSLDALGRTTEADAAFAKAKELGYNGWFALQRQIEATDRQIDALIYELCGLAEEEIEIVDCREVEK